MKILLLSMSVLLLFSCSSSVDFAKIRKEEAKRYFETLAARKAVNNKLFTLDECIKEALENNLNLKLEEMNRLIAEERENAATLGMLPQLTVSGNSTARDNTPGSSSESIQTGTQSLTDSKSSEKHVSTFKTELMISLLDFGLAYLTSQQSENSTLQADYKSKRMAQNLRFEVIQAYFSVASSQFLYEKVEKLISLNKDMEVLLEKQSDKKLGSPIAALEERKKLLKLQQALREYRRTYENDCIRLSMLMGLNPTSKIKVNTSVYNSLKDLSFADIEKLQKQALLKRPELFEQDIQVDTMRLEAEKALLKLFPNVNLFGSFNASTNKFLYNQNWWEIGVKATYDLLSLPSQYKKYEILKLNTAGEKKKTLALSIGIIAQVRIAHANLMEVKDRYKLVQNISRITQELSESAEKQAKVNGSISKLELLRLKLENNIAEIDRIREMGNVYIAYYRLMNTVGADSNSEMNTK